MTDRELNERIIERGRDFYRSIADEKPSAFDKNRWVGSVLEWCMENEEFKTQMFRFVDVFPTLKSSDSLMRHIREYFGDEELPSFLHTGTKVAEKGGKLGRLVLGKMIRRNIQEMGRQFIAGESTDEALKTVKKLRRGGFAFTLDVLGEATVNEQEGDQYTDTYLELLDELERSRRDWPALGDSGSELDWGHAPPIQVSVKPSAFYSQVRPQAPEDSLEGILGRLRRLCDKVVEVGGHLCLDMESWQTKNLTLELYRRLRREYPDYPHLGIALQAYLKETDEDIEQLVAWAREHRLPISVRLVKGAYWDYETILARQNGWPIPVYTDKAATDAAFERQSRRLLENHEWVHYACGSHNIRSIAAALETARALEIPEERYEFQVLYGMAEPVRKGLLNVAGRVRLYSPYGEMIPGMAYLVRRLLENTANESFLRQSFVEETEIEALLQDPAGQVQKGEGDETKSEATGPGDLPPFANEPPADFSRPEIRRAFAAGLAEVRDRLGEVQPLLIGGEDRKTAKTIDSTDPADPRQVVGRVSQAGPREVEQAIAAADEAFPAWRDTDPSERVAVLRRAAQIARERIYELAAWQVFEVGKQWDQSYADVTETIDFIEYYARRMIELAKPQRLGRIPGEENCLFYQPKGLATVIAPWNFPLAISCGMTSAALLTGNCVLYKPSSLSSVIGGQLARIYREAGVPAGVFNYLPGAGSEIGDLLVEHPRVSLIAFTGSKDVGLGILEKAARVQPGQDHVKKVVAEMGGKNAVIVDDDADLDEAVPHVLASAFGYQGQKCSACSRVIVLDEVYERFVDRLVKAAASLKFGPAADPAHAMGPVVDAEARRKVQNYIDLAEEEGEILYRSDVPDEGHAVPLTLVGGITPEHRLAREEVFGPVLAVMRARDFEQALQWANATPYALTGGIFSRSPARLERARREFRVGNLYLNRGITGSLVWRQPFGGFKLSGVGSKTGGPDYLLQFLDPRSISENTVRRGFAPLEEEN